mgnify:CR=1
DFILLEINELYPYTIKETAVKMMTRFNSIYEI